MMPDVSWASTPAVARSMRGNRRRDTGPELAIRRALHARGLRYRVDFAPLPGLRSRADIVFTRARVVIYVDGCFWHGCPKHGTVPVTNADYWVPKLKRNRERDATASRFLAESGWTVLRFWEHEEPGSVVERVIDKLKALAASDENVVSQRDGDDGSRD